MGARAGLRTRLVALLLLLAGLAAPAAHGQTDSDEADLRLGAAARTQAATRSRLGVLGDAFTCADARFVAYRRSTGQPELVDQWYVASQLWADATLLAVPVGPPPDWDAQDARCYLDKGFIFLDRLWDYTTAGYFPRSNPVGTQVEARTRFGDDNALGGLALLAAAGTTSDPRAVQRYVHAAEREADFLLQSNLWDDTFGGGFWWNTGRGDSPEGKPAQTNAIASLFFARLYAATGNSTYRDWSLRTMLWLDTILYDPTRHLYRWSVAFQDIKNRTGSTMAGRYFDYDQGIAIEAGLAAWRLDGDAGRLARARDVAAAIPGAFWSNELGGYNLEAGVEQVFPSYAAWTSLGLLALYDADGEARWIEEARRNANALSARTRNADGSYAWRAYVCVDRAAPGCESGQVRTVVDPVIDTAADAWSQHLEAALSHRLAAGRVAPEPAQPSATSESTASP